MTFKFKTAALIAGAAFAAVVQPARADVTITTRTTINSPMMDRMKASMTKDQLAAMDNMTLTTTYMSGKRYRADNPMMSMIVDAGAKRMIMLNATQRTYSVMPINPNMMKRIMGGAGAGMTGSGKPVYTVTDTGQTTKYLGHTCKHYIMDMKMNMGNMGDMTVHSDILAAQDLPGLDPAISGSLAMQMGMQGGQVKGVALVTRSKVTSALSGAMTMSQTATKISTDPIPAGKFEVPAGYTKTERSGFPGAPGTMPH